MATIKSFTDLEQSKKLAKILPLESADMSYRWCICKCINGEPIEDWLIELGKPFDECPDEQIPAWSLSALLELLPKRIKIVDNVYELSVYLYGLYYWNINNGNLCFEAKDKDNFVDAFYEAIVFLYEQKLL